MKVGKHLIIALFALGLYVIVPYGIHWGLTVLCMSLFLFISYDLLKEEFKNHIYISFNSVFLVSFFLTTFVFPVFILTSDTVFNKFVEWNFLVQFVDFKYLSRGVFLSLLAISIYAAAYQGYKRKKSKPNKRIFKRKIIDCLLAVFLLLTMINALFYLQKYGDTNLQQNGFILDFFKSFLIVSFLSRIPDIRKKPIGYNNFKYFIECNIYPITISIIAILLYLLFGARNMAISVATIMLMVIIGYYSKISIKNILLLLVAGTITLFVIRETRHSETSVMKSNISTVFEASNLRETPVLFLFSDLIGICQELSLGIEIKDRNGLQKPEQIFLIPFLPFPVLPSYVSDMFWDQTYQEATDATMLNDYMHDMYGRNATYGKHCVSDLYMKWGVIGVIAFFALLGSLSAKVNAKKRDDYYNAAMYLCLVSLSLFLARGSLVDLVRPLSYVCIMVWLFSRKQNKLLIK